MAASSQCLASRPKLPSTARISLKAIEFNIPKINVLGVDVHAADMEAVLEHVANAISQRKKLHIGVVNAAKVVNMKRNPELGRDVEASDLVLADGAGVVYAARLLGTPLPERVAGIDLMYEIMARGADQGRRVFCLGATEEVSQKVEEEIGRRFPGVVLAGRRNGYFSDEEEESVAEQIRDSKADVLFVAITSPKKENFMAKWSDLMEVPVVHGVGGSFDVMAGKVKRAPVLWQKTGMEWLYRVLQEPGRLWRRYLITNTLFISSLLKAMWNKRFSSSKTAGNA